MWQTPFRQGTEIAKCPHGIGKFLLINWFRLEFTRSYLAVQAPPEYNIAVKRASKECIYLSFFLF